MVLGAKYYPGHYFLVPRFYKKKRKKKDDNDKYGREILTIFLLY
jgi:hypothetical protein